jgi:hypothetical protein
VRKAGRGCLYGTWTLTRLVAADAVANATMMMLNSGLVEDQAQTQLAGILTA